MRVMGRTSGQLQADFFVGCYRLEGLDQVGYQRS